MWSAIDYMYRDAGNFKAFGTVIVEGPLRAADQEIIRSRLSSGEFFIAEQVGVPPLYHELYRWSRGITSLDHCWHEFIGVREIGAPEPELVTFKADELVGRFASVKEWDEELSAHFSVDIRP